MAEVLIQSWSISHSYLYKRRIEKEVRWFEMPGIKFKAEYSMHWKT